MQLGALTSSAPDTAPRHRPFSLYRLFVGGVRDAFQGITDTLDDIDRWSDELVGLAHDDNPLAYRPQLPQLEGTEDAGPAERLGRGLVSFAIPFSGALRATTALRGFGVLGRLGQGLAAGATADFVQYDPAGGNIANILRDEFGLDNAMLDSLAAEEDDTALMTRFKAAAAGAPLGLAGDAVFEAGGRMLKLYRAWKGTADEAAATVESLSQGPIKVSPPAIRTVDEAGSAAPTVTDEVPTVEADEVLDPVLGYQPRADEDFDDVVDFLKSRAGDLEMDEETFGRFARNLVEGDPENALAKLGVDPAKIDFSKYDDPEMLGRLHKGLAEVYEGIASRLGRLNTRGGALEAFEAMFWAVSANMLSKTWLTSLRQITDLVGATSQEDFDIRLDQVLRTFSTRVVPASGAQRTLEGWTNGMLREAAGFSDGLLQASLGADRLPVRRNFLGRPIEMSGMSRLAGVRASVMPFETDDPVMAELERLSMKEPAGARRQKGVKLNATQFSRFLELRGQVVRDPTTGLTMEEALNALFALPEYQALPKPERVAEIRKTIRGYSGLAAEALTNEDQSYALARLRQEVFELSNVEGWSPETRDAELARFAEQLGIPLN